MGRRAKSLRVFHGGCVSGGEEWEAGDGGGGDCDGDGLPPARRADCADDARPCKAWRCRYWLPCATVPGDPDEPGPRGRPTNCALDHAQDGPATLEAIGEALGVTRERIRQIEQDALGKLRNLGQNERQALGVFESDGSPQANHPAEAVEAWAGCDLRNCGLRLAARTNPGRL